MKIHELRFKNLNSLQGEWVIDFSAPDYAANGIFALTGPTGAGKSTILDGICLALYGATPRLGKITRSSNEIMSRQTGECYAEVFFESQAGRFRCHWEQRRARTKSSGKLQEQQHQIIDADTGKPIETKKSLVSKVIEEKTGMDFDRFTRSILLAQGGFDTFLKADDEQKSRILEQITGTGIYSAISRRVHERQRDELEKLNLLKAETSAIMLLEVEQEKELEQQLEQQQKEETDLIQKCGQSQEAITWLTGIEKLKDEITTLAEEATRLNQRRDDFAPERRRLDQALRAASVEGSHATLVAARTQRAEDQESLKGEQKKLPELKAAVKNSAETLKSAEQQTIKNKKEQQDAGPLLLRVRSLDQSCSEVRKNAQEIEDVCTKETSVIESNKENLRSTQKQQETTVKALQRAERYLADHAGDAWLSGGLTGIEEQVADLQRREAAQQEMQEKQKKAHRAAELTAKELDRLTRKTGDHLQQVDDISSRLKKERGALSDLLGDRLLREYRQEKEHLLREQLFLNRIIELEEHRSQLQDGRPCPLCGSMEHPYARGNVPKPDQTEKTIERLGLLIEKAENHETAVKKLEEDRAHAEKKLTAAEKQLTQAAYEKDTADKALVNIAQDSEKIEADAAEIKNSLVLKLKPLGISEISDKSGTELLKSLHERLQAWDEHIGKKAEIEIQLKGIEAEIKRLEAVIETRSHLLESNRTRLEKETGKLLDLSAERKKLFGDKNINDEEKRLSSAVEQAEHAEKKTGTRHQELNQELDAVLRQIDGLAKRIDLSTITIKKFEADFEAALSLIGFLNEQQFLAARLSSEERDRLAAQSKEIDSSLADLAARKKDRQNRLDEEAKRDVTGEPIEELKRQSAACEESLKQLRDDIASRRQQLDANRSARERITQKQAAIELQKKECGRWDKLHQLIGSADGKKYRTFAQGLTFELMVSHANRQLADMSDRYLLIRDDLQPLELNVVDNYQAGEIRSTRNLSGGESFMVSLALALGLSRMASRNVRVDSLFLDEGFGTLDEEALDGALTTLSALHQENKVIGIISHVPALKDRISTQISVTPLSGGRSTISGPGCAPISRAPGT